ncbi:uncharacterized protein G2W53_034513 [Senna tora]|uniref:Uncharacterized protein n=1 Tax=Senna tora TaxID=362788 RepID=A0A834T203_9FABA|nr:uncharacterized protein G2W53_034513 [Senna tora]
MGQNIHKLNGPAFKADLSSFKNKYLKKLTFVWIAREIHTKETHLKQPTVDPML